MKNFMKKAVKGFTLVELIIVVGLMAVLMLMVGLILKPISQVFADTTSYTEDRYVMDGIAQYLDESLKFADNMLVVYDRDYSSVSQTGFTSMKETVAYAMNVKFGGLSDIEKDRYLNRIQCIAIINHMSGTLPNDDDVFSFDDVIDNSGIYHTGRVYKSEFVRNDPSDPDDGYRKVWLVGGEAFYGDGSYFINIEGKDNDDDEHIDGNVGQDVDGDGTSDYEDYGLKYTIYSFDLDRYKDDCESEDDYDDFVSNNLPSFRGNTREDIGENALIKNYSENFIELKNKPFDNDIIGLVSPLSGNKSNADIENEDLKNGNTGLTMGGNPGYNIYIYYTVPE